ncbi:MAG: hypothetical protein M1834_008985 [Cirrosporium novae-zelandiae]|nr:MAG: hypothetical protein M1834_008985 [Cirrosporium novae-zelandiae]
MSSDPKFSDFDIYTTVYTEVNSQAIDVDVLIPKGLKTLGLEKKKCPVVVRFHGGGLVTGTSLFTPWFPTWQLTVARTTNAILLSPNHRLLPESTPAEILSDLSSFWTWVLHSLPTYLSTLPYYPALMVSLENILCVGESAGGFLGVHSGLSLPKGTIGAMALSYPMLDLRDAWFVAKPVEGEVGRHPFGAPTLDPGLIDGYLAKGREARAAGKIITSVTPPARTDFLIALLQHGWFCEIFGEGEELYPIDRVQVESKKGKRLPPMLILHGKEDSAVPVKGSERFLKTVRECMEGVEVRLVVREGDHGFDTGLGGGEEWLRRELEWVRRVWLG